MQIFSVDGQLYKFIVRFWDMVKLNFMWLIFSLPIITIGASTVAAYSVALKMVKDNEGHVVKQFVEAFKQNWKQGIPMGLIMLVAVYSIYLNIEFFNKIDGNPIMFLFAAIILIFLTLIYSTYAFALCARHENTIIATIKNSAAISTKYFSRTILLWLIIAFIIVLFMFNTTLMFIGFIIGPASIFLTVSAFALKCFEDIDKEVKSGIVKT